MSVLTKHWVGKEEHAMRNVLDELDNFDEAQLLIHLLDYPVSELFSKEIVEGNYNGELEPSWTSLVKKRYLVGFTFYNRRQETHYMVSDKPIDEDTYKKFRDDTMALAAMTFSDKVTPLVKPIPDLTF